MDPQLRRYLEALAKRDRERFRSRLTVALLIVIRPILLAAGIAILAELLSASSISTQRGIEQSFPP